MPAVRSRTENWRRSLEQLCERGGSIELALPASEDAIRQGAAPDDGAVDLMWRVRVVKVGEDGLRIESPETLGQAFELHVGSSLVGVISIGQNRWMFRTEVLEPGGSNGGPVLKLPAGVERCQRRSFYRASTASLSLPTVWVAPLLDLEGVTEAERACRDSVLQVKQRDVVARIEGDHPPIVEAMPETEPRTGPGATSTLVNLGGGGVGLLFEPEHSGIVAPQRLVWMRLRLPPHVPAPLVIVGRMRHSHIDSSRRVYAGVAFEFGHHAGYREFVVDQLCRYVALVQRQQRSGSDVVVE
ncbi:MAG: hypothetical protein AAGI30_11985 [Planctomycetota bacterium]